MISASVHQIGVGGRHTSGVSDLVTLDDESPTFRDKAYLARRNHIASLALKYRTGAPVPFVQYRESEHHLWGTFNRQLEPLHREHVCSFVLQAQRRMMLDQFAIPQLAEVNKQLAPYSKFQMIPIAGMVKDRIFFSYLAHNYYLATQYVRHEEALPFTPEPDVFYELLGHAALLADERYASTIRDFGAAAQQADGKTLRKLSRLYWYTFKTGVVHEEGKNKAFGSALLSSATELQNLPYRDLRPFSIDEMIELPIDTTHPQSTLFVVPNVDTLFKDVRHWLRGMKNH
jgi:phenylalanine-4-hydroxylase